MTDTNDYQALLNRYYVLREFAKQMLDTADDLKFDVCSEYHGGDCNCSSVTKQWEAHFHAVTAGEPKLPTVSRIDWFDASSMAKKTAFCEEKDISVVFDVVNGPLLKVTLTGSPKAMEAYEAAFRWVEP